MNDPKSDELAARRAGDDAVGITDVDCTPRPRWRESQAAFDARMRGLGAAYQAEVRRDVTLPNRASSVRAVTGPHGEHLHMSFCACGFHGLQVADPELARREYDAHACTVIDGDAIHGTYRGGFWKRAPSTMVPALASERAAAGVTLPGEADAAPTTQTTTGDEFEQRVKLLEIGASDDHQSVPSWRPMPGDFK